MIADRCALEFLPNVTVAGGSDMRTTAEIEAQANGWASGFQMPCDKKGSLAGVASRTVTVLLFLLGRHFAPQMTVEPCAGAGCRLNDLLPVRPLGKGECRHRARTSEASSISPTISTSMVHFHRRPHVFSPPFFDII